MLNSKMKKLVTSMIALILCLSSVSAMACTAIYVGSDLTADGNTIFVRSEDIANSYNKLFCVSPAGRHTAGEEYAGCCGFTCTFAETAIPTPPSATTTATRRAAFARTAAATIPTRPTRRAAPTRWA